MNALSDVARDPRLHVVEFQPLADGMVRVVALSADRDVLANVAVGAPLALPIVAEAGIVFVDLLTDGDLTRGLVLRV
ncbi:hypothetical protein GCM10023087_29770 [Microbacterium rhizosphaerae]